MWKRQTSEAAVHHQCLLMGMFFHKGLPSATITLCSPRPTPVKWAKRIPWLISQQQLCHTLLSVHKFLVVINSFYFSQGVNVPLSFPVLLQLEGGRSERVWEGNIALHYCVFEERSACWSPLGPPEFEMRVLFTTQWLNRSSLSYLKKRCTWKHSSSTRCSQPIPILFMSYKRKWKCLSS